MSVKLFILGRPGTGKSRAARRIVELAEQRNLSIKRINDFCILQEMCNGEHAQKFEWHEEQPGFDVLDPLVLDIALEEVQARAHDAMKMHDIVIIEFARTNYSKALSKFDASFLTGAFFMFLDSDARTCIERIHRRVDTPLSPDDYPVSEKIFSAYYRRGLFLPLLKILLIFRFALRWDRVLSIKNSGSLNQFTRKITSTVFPMLVAALDRRGQVTSVPSSSAIERVKEMVESASESVTKVGAFFL